MLRYAVDYVSDAKRVACNSWIDRDGTSAILSLESGDWVID
jgi:hypothetical protein